MSTRYVSILARHPPFPIGLDGNGRVEYSCNYDLHATAPALDPCRDVAKMLSDASLGSLVTHSGGAGNTVIGPAAKIPDLQTPTIQLVSTGGRDPDSTHNGSTYDRISLQVIVRAVNIDSARELAQSIYSLLDSTYNVTVTI